MVSGIVYEDLVLLPVHVNMTRLRNGSRTALTATFIPGDLLLRESTIQSSVVP